MVGCVQQSPNPTPQERRSIQVAAKGMTGDDFIALLKSNVTCDWSEKTVDNFKEGDSKQEIKGIITTFMATQEVLRQAVAKGCNLIVTHEPTFYNHLDARDLLEEDQVYLEKLKFIRNNQLLIFRFHDHWHKTEPDGIYEGMVKELGWQAFRTNHKMIYEIPSTTLGELAAFLRDHFKSTTIRLVGSAEFACSKIGLSVGAHGVENELGLLARDDVEVLIAGEVREWETVEYVRDAQIQGKAKALIVMGHADSEEAGMQYCAEWLKTFIAGIPVEHVPAGNPLQSIGTKK